ncbi:hypothetical protein GBF35_08860 [Nonomuraea phyllanthi]|uniref:hypothetical protein n=1 Tax=Nonomuraea phyllanthi TaxID=2219224 RepID=UPI001293E63F|nr:hypothetical protein [Nonomuraea phyllanthi]QFY06788.1 hypothetical protein GBF35_08860 [Nonomuraea phyllanthi]
MEDDRRVWPPQAGPRHRRTPPRYAWGPPHAETPRRGRPGPLEAVPDPEPEPGPDAGREPLREPDPGSARDTGWQSLRDAGWESVQEPDPGSRREPHPLDLDPGEPWNPRIRGTGQRREDPWDDPREDSLPPSARLRGSPVDPGRRVRVAESARRRWTGVTAAALAGVALVAGATVVVLRTTAPPEQTGRLSDALAGVTAALPQGWTQGAVPPVTGFTSVVRDGDGGLVMAKPVPGPVEDAGEATTEAAELYSRLLLKGDRVNVVEDKGLPGGHTRALRAEYRDVANRPAYLRVTMLTRGGDPVLLVGLLQPEESGRRQALDAVMTSIR